MGQFTERRFVTPVLFSAEDRQRITHVLRDTLVPYTDIVFGYIYGSFARGEACRDIDVALYTREDTDAFLALDLVCLLGDVTGREVDVIVLNNAPVALQFAVFRDGQLLFSRDEALRTTLIARTGRRYWEYAHFRNLFLGAVGARPEQSD